MSEIQGDKNTEKFMENGLIIASCVALFAILTSFLVFVFWAIIIGVDFIFRVLNFLFMG